MQQTLRVFFPQFCYRYTSPVGHNVGNFFGSYNFGFCGSLVFPFFRQLIQFFPFLFFLIPILSRFFIFLIYNSSFFFFTQPFDFFFQRFDICRRCVVLQTDSGCRFVDQVNGFVRQETIGNIPAG